MDSRLIRRLLPILGAALVALVGAAVLWSGLTRTAAFGGDRDVIGRLPQVSQPVVVTAPGMTELAGGQLTVRATAPAGRGVFIGVGRADDVDAYLGSVARGEVTALEPNGTLRVAARGGQPSLPDPAGVDVWAAETRTAGEASLTWPRAAGRWLVVIAVDGRTPPTSAGFTWSGTAGSSPAPALIAIGAVLLVAGVAALLAIRSGRMFATDPDEAERAERSRRAAERARAERSARIAARRSAHRATPGPDATGDAPEATEASASTDPIDPADRADSTAAGDRVDTSTMILPRTGRRVAQPPPSGAERPAVPDPATGPLPTVTPVRASASGRPPAPVTSRSPRRGYVPPATDAAAETAGNDDADDEATPVRPFRHRGSAPEEDD